MLRSNRGRELNRENKCRALAKHVIERSVFHHQNYERSSLLIKAWGDLDETFRPGTYDRILVQNLKSDLQPGGDLRALFEDKSTRDRIQELIKRSGA